MTAHDQSLRASGRTTRRVAQYLKDLLAAPGIPIVIMDHFDNRNSHRQLQHTVGQHLQMLGVKFDLNVNDLTITVKPIRKRTRVR